MKILIISLVFIFGWTSAQTYEYAGLWLSNQARWVAPGRTIGPAAPSLVASQLGAESIADHVLINILNHLGTLGWELTGISNTGNETIYLFKRIIE